ncbi:Uncharacterised protein [Vibrio cholerae]|nr:Uncharacterised protein [Vibrio cholerae]
MNHHCHQVTLSLPFRILEPVDHFVAIYKLVVKRSHWHASRPKKSLREQAKKLKTIS